MKLYLSLLFIWAKINAAGATLLPSTHYAELLDQFQRNDCIYIARNINGISIENLSKILNRNDIKKNDAYQSDFLKEKKPLLNMTHTSL
mgnify:CR=1 FL=1